MLKTLAAIVTGNHDATIEPVETAWDTLYKMARQNRKAVLFGTVPSTVTLDIQSYFLSDEDFEEGREEEMAVYWRGDKFYHVSPEMVVHYL